MREWWLKAACGGAPSEIFFPHDSLANDRWNRARAYCVSCAVCTQCLDEALGYEDHEDRWGMFGGMTPGERRIVRDYRRRNDGRGQ